MKSGFSVLRFVLKRAPDGRLTQEVRRCGEFSGVEQAFDLARMEVLREWQEAVNQPELSGRPGRIGEFRIKDTEWGLGLRAEARPPGARALLGARQRPRGHYRSLKAAGVSYFKAAAMRARAVSTLARELKALMRTWPSPHLPKPAPGVQTTWAWFSRRSKNSHESRPVFTQM